MGRWLRAIPPPVADETQRAQAEADETDRKAGTESPSTVTVRWLAKRSLPARGGRSMSIGWCSKSGAIQTGYRHCEV